MTEFDATRPSADEPGRRPWQTVLLTERPVIINPGALRTIEVELAALDEALEALAPDAPQRDAIDNRVAAIVWTLGVLGFEVVP